MRRIEFELPFEPRLARRVHRAAALLGGVRRLFLRVILRRLKNRQSVPMATATPRALNCSRSSESVMSLLAATAERISSACASIRCEWRSPPWSLGLTSPSRRSMARHRIALEALTPNRCAAARHDNPPSIAPTTRLRRSTDKDLAMHASLLRRPEAGIRTTPIRESPDDSIGAKNALVGDLAINKPLGLSPKGIEFKRAYLPGANP